jgi:hypothetical protein
LRYGGTGAHRGAMLRAPGLVALIGLGAAFGVRLAV